MRFLIFCLVLTCAPVASDAQPFSKLDLGAGMTANVFAPDLRPWWTPGFGGDLGVRTPFYRGVIEAGGSIHHYRSRHSGVPRFTSAFAFAGWGVRADLGARFGAYAGGRLGIYTMVFDEEPDIRNRSEYESEMAVSPVFAVQRPVGGRWSAFVEVQHVIVFTAVRLQLTYVTIGARRSLAAPEWLRSFLE